MGFFIALLLDPDRKEWEFAATVLGKSGNPRAVEPLMRALEDPGGNLGDPRAVEPLIIAALDIHLYFTNEAAAEGLGKLGDPHAIQPLIEIVKNRDLTERNPSLRQQTAVALMKIQRHDH